MEWLDEAVKYIQEDKRDHYLTLLSMMPVARSAMDEKGGRAINNYMKDLRNAIFAMTPWERQAGSVRSAYRGKVKSGTVAVVLDDYRLKKDPTFRDANVIK